jgi:uncharacterized protein (TIGR00369 family)
LTSDRAVGAGAAPEVGGDDLEEGTFDLAAHRCFACGELNAHGIRMPLHIEADHAWSEIVLDPAFQGWDGIAHGGILATLLDEGMAWAIAAREAFGFTARMTVEYRRPVPVGVPIRVDGRVLEARRRLIRAEADISDPATGAVYAHADGTYVIAPPEQAEALRGRYRFSGAAPAAGAAGAPGMRRWRVRQTLPPVEPAAQPVQADDMPDPGASA